MNNNDVIIKVDNLTKTYNLYDKPWYRVKEIFSVTHKSYSRKYNALNNVSFQVKRGETLGIIGKNGAGKSTLLKILTGVVTPTNGKVSIDGEISALLELGTGFNPEYNGYENIYLNGSMRGYSREEMAAKIQEIEEFADIGDYINQPIKTYSSGMLARLAFAVMVCFKPEILIVDEALSVGDVFFQQKCNTYMKEEMKGVTKLLVTHDMNSIANMADRVIMMDKGKIIQEGKPLEVIENYLKLMHTEMYEKTNAQSENQNEVYASHDKFTWNMVGEDDIGGAGEVKFKGIRVFINDDMIDVVKAGDTVNIEALFNTKKDCGNLIIGYTFKDKYGNSIFAMNTMGAGIRIEGMKKNTDYVMSLKFVWPEIKEGDYFLTLGIGEGEDQMVHVIQCWAHNIYHVEAISLRPMHGIINHTIDKFEIGRVEVE